MGGYPKSCVVYVLFSRLSVGLWSTVRQLASALVGFGAKVFCCSNAQKGRNKKQRKGGGEFDCSQSPYFPVGFSRPVRFDGAAAILVCKSERDLGRVSKLPRGGERSWEALAFTNQEGGDSIEAYRSRESHGKIGGL